MRFAYGGARRGRRAVVAVAGLAALLAAPPGEIGAYDISVPNFDRDSDGRADAVVVRTRADTLNLEWWFRRSGGGTDLVTWGRAGDVRVPGDYDGDRRIDAAIWRRPSTPDALGQFWIRYSTGGSQMIEMGESSDVPIVTPYEPVVADYDGDGKTDLALWYRVLGPPDVGPIATYQIRSSIDGAVEYWEADVADYKPATADFDGDGFADLAGVVAEAGVLVWYTDRTPEGDAWGYENDRLVVGDFDGDQRADQGIVRCVQSVWEWWIKLSGGGHFYVPFGFCGPDVPVLADHTGDGKVDVAVWRRPSGPFGSGTGQFLIRSSSSGAMESMIWGIANDVPASQLH